MLVLLEKDGPARVAVGQVGSVGGDGGHGLVERGEHMGCRLSIFLYASGLTMAWKIDDSDMVQITCLQPGTLCVVCRRLRRCGYSHQLSSSQQQSEEQCSQSCK